MIRKSLRLLIILLLFIPLGALPLGLGPIQIKSSLNQLLDAEIELLSPQSGELAELAIQLASPQAFEQAGIDRAAPLSDLEFSLQSRPGGRNVIKVSSQRPVREPALNFLLELSGARGQVVREFTVLLDPPDFMEQAPVAAGIRSARPATQAAGGERRPSSPRPAPAANYQGGEVYGPVAPGETLYRIANRVRPASVSVERMMQSLLEANPQAFLAPNIDSLMAGVNLRIPSFQESVAAAETSQHSPSQETASMAAEPDDAAPRLRLLATEETETQPDPAPQATAATPAAIDPAFLIKLHGDGLKLRLAGIDDLQARIDALPDVDKLSLPAIQAPVPELPLPALAFQEALPAETAAVSEWQDTMVDATQPDSESVSSETEEVSPAALQTAAVQTLPAGESLVVNSPMLQESALVYETTFLDTLIGAALDDPMSMAPAGFGALLLTALLMLRHRRRAGSSANEESEVDEWAPAVVAAPIEVATRSPDSPAAVQAERSNAVVNPLERVDLLMAVGNYREAENTVRLVLAEDPANIVLTAKLLEIHFARGNADAFREEAERLRDMIEDLADPVWQQVVAMGRELRPHEALFGGSFPSASATPQAASIAAALVSTGKPDDLDLDLDRFSIEGWQPDAQAAPASENESAWEATETAEADRVSATTSQDMHEDLAFEAPGAQEDQIALADEENVLTDAFAGLEWQSPGAELSAAESEPLQAEEAFDDSLLNLDFALEGPVEDSAKAGTDATTTDPSAAEDYVDTKLDLALAYLDMDDPVGARSLLEEVLQEGSASQREQAGSLLERLASAA